MNKIDELIEVGKQAKINKRCLLVKVIAPDLEEPELIINPPANVLDKLVYYKLAYTDDLKLKANNNIQIIDFMQYDMTNGDTYYAYFKKEEEKCKRCILD